MIFNNNFRNKTPELNSKLADLKNKLQELLHQKNIFLSKAMFFQTYTATTQQLGILSLIYTTVKKSIMFVLMLMLFNANVFALMLIVMLSA